MIEKEITLSLGVEFFISVVLEYSLGVELSVEPPLPSSIIVMPSFIAGNITQLIEGEYTIHAKVNNHVISRVITIHSEVKPLPQYFIHLLTGRGPMRATISDEVLVDSSVNGGFQVPFSTLNETLHLQFTCRNAEGCWLTIESMYQHLPSIFVHHNEHFSKQYVFPLEALSVKPLITDVVGMLHQPIPTILWEQKGLYSDVFIDDLPSWMVYNPLENRIDGIAEEIGVFSGSISIVSETAVIDFPVNITIYDTFTLAANETAVSVVYHNQNHSSLLTYYSSFADTLEYEVIPLEMTSPIQITSYLILTDGLYNLTFGNE